MKNSMHFYAKLCIVLYNQGWNSTTVIPIVSRKLLMTKLHSRSHINNIYIQYVALFVHVAQLLCAIKKEQFLGAAAQHEEKMIVLNKTKILHLQQGLRHHQDFSLNFYKFHFLQVRCVFKKLVFCCQNCSDLLWEKIVLVIEKHCWNSRLNAENLQIFWDH